MEDLDVRVQFALQLISKLRQLLRELPKSSGQIAFLAELKTELACVEKALEVTEELDDKRLEHIANILLNLEKLCEVSVTIS